MKHRFYRLRYKFAAAVVNYLRPRLKSWLEASINSWTDEEFKED